MKALAGLVTAALVGSGIAAPYIRGGPCAWAASRPGWLTRVPEEPGAVYAVGVRTGAVSLEDGRRGAVDSALEDLARYLGVTVTARLRSMKTALADKMEDAVSASAAGRVRSSHIREVYTERSRARYDVWVLLRYPAAEVAEERARLAAEERRLTEAIAQATQQGRRSAGLGDASGAFQQFALALSMAEEAGPGASTEPLSEAMALFRRLTLTVEPAAADAGAATGLPQPLRAHLRYQPADAALRPIAGVPVRFRFVEGRGALEPRALTDGAGLAESRVRGLHALEAENRVEARVELADLLPVAALPERAQAVPPLRAEWVFGSSGRREDLLDAPQVVLVEPFQSSLDDPAAGWLAGGVEASLRDRLSQVKTVRAVDDAAREEADAVVGGTVQKAGGEVRITARIVDGGRRRVLGSASATGRWGELFRLQEQLAGQVLMALRVSPDGDTGQIAGAGRPETTSLAAYRAFVEGNQALARGAAGEAESDLLRAVEADPKYAKAWNNLGAARMRASRPGEAFVAYRRAADLDPLTPRHWVNMAAAAQAAGVPEPVEPALTKALETDPDFLPALLVKGELLRRSGRPAEALEILERAVRTAPYSAEAHNALGVARDQAGDVAKAEAAYRRAIAVDPRLARAHSNLGSVYDRQGRHAEAVASFRTALALDPKSAAAWTNLALAYAHLGDGASAVQVARLAADLNPGSEAVRKNLEMILGSVAP